MKYRLKIDYIPMPEYQYLAEDNQTIKKGEILEVLGYSEPVKAVCCIYKNNQINIPLQVFLFITEEYKKTAKVTFCRKCKHYEKCQADKTRSWYIAVNSGFGYCGLYEEKK